MTRTTSELPEKLLAWLHPGGPALLLTMGEDGFPNVAYTWAAAPDARRIRFGADHGSATLANLQRDGRAALEFVGPGNLVFLVKGTTRMLQERIAAAPFRIALIEMVVTETKDQSWPGVIVAPLAYEWPEDQREAMRAMEQAVYVELREAEAASARSVPLVYLVRHGEVEHHRTDVNLTPRGRAQAETAGAALADLLAEGDTVLLYHSPVKRVKETADLMHASIDAALKTSGRNGRVHLHAPRQDQALCNVRFFAARGEEPEEPSLLYARINTPAFLQDLLPAQVDFYRGFWASADPMGYWLTHDSAGGAETVEVVLARLQGRLRSLFDPKRLSENSFPPQPALPAPPGSSEGGPVAQAQVSEVEGPALRSPRPEGVGSGAEGLDWGGSSATAAGTVASQTGPAKSPTEGSGETNSAAKSPRSPRPEGAGTEPPAGGGWSGGETLSPRGRVHWIGITHSGAMRALLRAAFGDDPGEPNFCESILIAPSDQTGWVTLSYRGRSASLNMADR